MSTQFPKMFKNIKTILKIFQKNISKFNKYLKYYKICFKKMSKTKTYTQTQTVPDPTFIGF